MIAQALADLRAEAPILIGSAAVVLFMVGVAWLLGFRAKTRLDEGALAGLAEADGACVEASVIAPNGRAALARLSNGKLLIARVMGDDVAVRAAAAEGVRLALGQGRVRATFADPGFPPLDMKLEETPPWLAELAKGQG